MDKEIQIHKRYEITIAGITRVRELYASGYLDQSGRLHLTACVGSCGPMKQVVGTATTFISENAA